MDRIPTHLLADILIRYPATGILVLAGLLAVRDHRGSHAVLLAAMTSFSCAALLLSSAPEVLRLPFPAYFVLRLIDTTTIPLAWWLGLSLFDDDFRPGRLEWGGLLAMISMLVVWRLDLLGVINFLPVWLDPAIDVLSLGMIAHVVWTAFKGRKDDLVERRRRVRFWFALGIAAATLISVATDEFMATSEPEQATFILALVIGALTLWGALWLLRLTPESLRFEVPVFVPSAAPGIDPKDAAAYGRLIHLMEAEKAYLKPGLTIGALAEEVGIPEHQLRALINGGLGHRNFAGFLNGYRLAHAKVRLADPNEARIPILTIALDSGFSSLAPFNRAFKATEGVTPSEFRAQALKAG